MVGRGKGEKGVENSRRGVGQGKEGWRGKMRREAKEGPAFLLRKYIGWGEGPT